MPIYNDTTAAAADGLIGYVPFDEFTGSAIDDKMASGTASLDGTVDNDPDDSTIVVGKFGNARDFGVHAAAPEIYQNKNDFTNQSADCSVSLWVKLNSLPLDTSSKSLVLFRGQTSGYNTGLNIQVIAGEAFVQASIAGINFYSDTALIVDQWHHLVLTKNDGGAGAHDIRLYQDNAQVGSSSSSLNTHRFQPYYDFRVCAFSDRDATVDDIGCWNKVIGSTLRTNIWNGGTGDTLVDVPVIAKALVGIEVQITDPNIEHPKVTLEIDVTQRLSQAKVFIESVMYDPAPLSLGIEVQVTDPVSKAEVGLEVQVFDTQKAVAPVEVQIFDHALVSSMRWKPVVFVDGAEMSNRVIEQITITYTVNASAIASIVYAPESGPLDLFALVGKPVTVDYVEVDSSGAELKRVRKYSGKVDKPSYTPDRRRITLTCTNDLQGRVATMSRAEIDGVVAGLWSPHIFNDNASNWQYFQDQLSTVEADIWIDSSNIMRRSDWFGGSVDYEYTDASKILDSVRVINPDKGDIINQVDITLDFRYSRDIQRNVFYETNYTQTLCHFLEENTFKLPTRALIERAADSAGWVRMGAIAYVPLWEPTNRSATSTVEGGFQETGTVNCGGETKGWTGDPGGDNPEFCIGASFTLSKRWTKTITEVYQLTVKAPESISANGTLQVSENYGIAAETDDASWESNYTPLEAVRDIPGNTTTIGLPLVMPAGSEELENGDWMFPADEAEGSGRSAMETAQVVAETKARVEILDGHRSRDVVFSVPLDPFITLDNVIRLNTTTVKATGKVRALTDTMDIRTGRVDTTITLASSGSGTGGVIADDPIVSIEAIPDYPLTEYDRYVWMPWRLGGRLSSVPYNEDWVGYTANYEYDPDDNSRPDPFSPFDADSSPPDVNAYPEQFVVTTPDISENDRQSEEAQVAQSFNVNIPTDELIEVA